MEFMICAVISKFTPECLLCRAWTRAHSENADELKKTGELQTFAVYWDGKMMPSLDSKYKLNDWLLVIVSGGRDTCYFQEDV